jgi:hypothetical protein
MKPIKGPYDSARTTHNQKKWRGAVRRFRRAGKMALKHGYEPPKLIGSD